MEYNFHVMEKMINLCSIEDDVCFWLCLVKCICVPGKPVLWNLTFVMLGVKKTDEQLIIWLNLIKTGPLELSLNFIKFWIKILK